MLTTKRSLRLYSLSERTFFEVAVATNMCLFSNYDQVSERPHGEVRRRSLVGNEVPGWLLFSQRTKSIYFLKDKLGKLWSGSQGLGLLQMFNRSGVLSA